EMRLRSYTARRAAPNFENGQFGHSLVPADVAAIYNIAPLHAAGVTGNGGPRSTVVVVGQSDVSADDTKSFRTAYHLPTVDDVEMYFNKVDPGFNENEAEGDLDLQWVSAVAPGARLRYVVDFT